jgi:hypothetical protein
MLLLQWARRQALYRYCLSHPEGAHHNASSAAACVTTLRVLLRASQRFECCCVRHNASSTAACITTLRVLLRVSQRFECCCVHHNASSAAVAVMGTASATIQVLPLTPRGWASSRFECCCCGGLVFRHCTGTASHTLRVCIITLRVLLLRWARRQALYKCCLSHPEGVHHHASSAAAAVGPFFKHCTGAASHTLRGCIITLRVLLLQWARCQAR